ncbi:L,D-transpeptidase [Pontivivens insulae]|uniref:Putative L,D-transpeptidase ErfK/SrfK n=1 Tax=Pontivivens insulae TaxID=1639689 RepID=A0A2R8A8Z6_9RHOB|nr:L,D-transpeptidase [Pontivivens insulae]RED18727.1 L,D-transpeptidase-like protein [Pontivivens insulae]SPF28625.1 putative L,D-transpeptidase ErfK/SrfK [Pontivivens insulae]
MAFSRRSLLQGLAAGTATLAAPSIVLANSGPDWKPYFDRIDQGGLHVSTTERKVTYWTPGGHFHRRMPTAIPRTEELTRRGRTEIVRKRAAPSWNPTPDMLRRDPNLQGTPGGHPDNPLGSHALYFDWTYYAIHGTNDPSSVGEAASSGCFRLHAEDIAFLYFTVPVGTPVLVT